MPFDYAHEDEALQSVAVSSQVMPAPAGLVVVQYRYNPAWRKTQVLKSPVIMVRSYADEHWLKAGPLDPEQEKCHACAADFEEAGYRYQGRHQITEFLYVSHCGVGVDSAFGGVIPRCYYHPDTRELVWAGCVFVTHTSVSLDEDHVRDYAARHWEELPPVAEDDDDDDAHTDGAYEP